MGYASGTGQMRAQERTLGQMSPGLCMPAEMSRSKNTYVVWGSKVHRHSTAFYLGQAYESLSRGCDTKSLTRLYFLGSCRVCLSYT